MPTLVDRRVFLAALPALAATPRLFAQAASTIKVRGLTQMTLTVSDVKRSLDFYQGLFGMPIQARQGDMVFLRIGNGPQYLALKPAAAGARPWISHYGMGVEGFNADQVMKTLADHGVTAADATAADAPMKARRVNRGGTTEIFVGDPSGVIFQLQDVSYCGGAGPLGNQCRTVEPSPKKGLLTTRDMSHFTVRATDPTTQDFYKQVFGFGVRAMQATTPGYAVGPGVHFLMFIGGAPAAPRGGGPGAAGGGAPAGGGGRGAGAGGGGAPDGAAAGRAGAGGAAAAGGGGGRGAAQPAAIDHACMSIDNFVPDNVIKTLADYGVKPSETQGRANGPLQSYISLRMPNRGGAEGGTPELYFTDPDNLAIQLQDVKYCGGGGFLGEVCLS